MVKMYELDTTEAQAEAATAAAAEFRDYVMSLIEQRRRGPQDDLVTRLVEACVEGERLSDAQIVSTIIVLLNAGHEATVNTLGNGVRALLHHREQWQRLLAGEVERAEAIEELIRWDPPLQLFERWALEEGVEIAGPASAAGSTSASGRRSPGSSSKLLSEPWWRTRLTSSSLKSPGPTCLRDLGPR